MVDLSSLAGAGWQFFDDNGDPLSGGKLYTYSAGTTSPLTAYTSSDGLTPHPNPIILDSAGRVPSEIWLTTGLTYKFVLTSSSGTAIWTKDNVPGIYAAQIVSATGISVSGGGTLQDLIGPQSAYISKIVDAKRYGLVPNDQSAGPANFAVLQTVIAAANNKIIQLPEDNGIYEFAGDPGQPTQIAQTAQFTNVAEIRGGGARLQNLRFVSGAANQKFIDIKQQYANFVANLNGGSTVAIRHSGVEWRGFDLRAQSNLQDGNTGSFDVGRSLLGVISDVKILDGYASNGVVDGIDVYGNVDTLLIRGVTLRNSDDGVVLKTLLGTGPVRNVIVAECDVECASLIAVGTQVAFDVSNVTVSNCLFSRYGRCIYIKNTNLSQFGGNVYNINVSDVVISSPSNPAGAYNTPPYVTAIVSIAATNGGRVENLTFRNARFDGVTVPDALGGGTAIFIDTVAPSVVSNIVIDGLDIYQRDPAGYANADVWNTLLRVRGNGTYGPMYIGNITYDAYANAGMTSILRVGSGAAAQINVMNPIDVKKSGASIALFTVDTGASDLTLDANANIAVPTTATVTTSAGFRAGDSPIAKAQRQINVPIPSVSAGVALTMAAMTNARRCVVTRATISASTAVPQSDTAYLTLQVRGANVVATATTQLTGGINILANTQVDLATPNLGVVMPAGDVVRFSAAHTGGGQNLTGAVLTLHVIDLE